MKKVLLVLLFALLAIGMFVSCDNNAVVKNEMVTLTLRQTPTDALFYTTSTNLGIIDIEDDDFSAFTSNTTLKIECPKNATLLSALTYSNDYIYVFDNEKDEINPILYLLNFTECINYSTSSDFENTSSDLKALIIDKDMDVWCAFEFPR